MIFGLSGSTSKTRSDQQSTSSSSGVSAGFSDSSSSSIGGSSSTSIGGGSSFGRSGESIAFEPFFADLFAQATGAAGRSADAIPELTNRINGLFNSGLNVLDGLQGGAGQSFLENQLNDDGLVNEQIEIASDDITRFLENDILPAVDARGVAANTFGGSRGDLARGEAGAGAIREFARVSAGIRESDRNQRLGIAQFLEENERADAGATLAGLPGLAGLAQLSSSADLNPFAQLSGILGPVTALGESESRSENFSSAQSDSFSRAIADAISRNFSSNQSESQSTASSRGKSKSFGIDGLGG